MSGFFDGRTLESVLGWPWRGGRPVSSAKASSGPDSVPSDGWDPAVHLDPHMFYTYTSCIPQ